MSIVLIKQQASFIILPGKPFNLFNIKAFRFCRFFLSSPNPPIVPNLWLLLGFNNKSEGSFGVIWKYGKVSFITGKRETTKIRMDNQRLSGIAMNRNYWKENLNFSVLIGAFHYAGLSQTKTKRVRFQVVSSFLTLGERCVNIEFTIHGEPRHTDCP